MKKGEPQFAPFSSIFLINLYQRFSQRSL